ncbi:TPA: hypothetical protein ACH3X3_013361 [Trebouxia sp. C0006]
MYVMPAAPASNISGRIAAHGSAKPIRAAGPELAKRSVSAHRARVKHAYVGDKEPKANNAVKQQEAATATLAGLRQQAQAEDLVMPSEPLQTDAEILMGIRAEKPMVQLSWMLQECALLCSFRLERGITLTRSVVNGTAFMKEGVLCS